MYKKILEKSLYSHVFLIDESIVILKFFAYLIEMRCYYLISIAEVMSFQSAAKLAV
ncbi:hypothetical protein ABH953_003198 [Bacillus sp. RC236]